MPIDGSESHDHCDSAPSSRSADRADRRALPPARRADADHLLDALRDGEATVRELQEATGASQQNVSKHLGVLLRSGIVGRRKEGTFSVYWIADPMVFSLCEEVCGGYGAS